jgi:NADPH:quinone reductase
MVGREGAGVVVDVGARVTEVAVGDRVVYSGRSSDSFAGSYANYAAVPAAAVVPLPDAVGFEDGCAALIQGTTAHYLMCDSYQVQPGEWVLIHAAAGGTGTALVQIAKLKGARVIATCSAAEKASYVAELGADYTVLYSDRAGDWVSTVRELTSDEGVAAVFDGVGKDTFLKGFKCLRRHRGAMIMFGEASGRSELIATRELLIRAYIHGKNPKVSKQTVSHTTAITDSNIGLEQEHPSLSM